MFVFDVHMQGLSMIKEAMPYPSKDFLSLDYW